MCLSQEQQSPLKAPVSPLSELPKLPSQQAIDVAARLMAIELVHRRNQAKQAAGEGRALPNSESQQRQGKV